MILNIIKIILFFYVILLNIAFSQLENKCGIGCINCQQIDLKFECLDCQQGYQIDPIYKNCVYQQCEDSLVGNKVDKNGIETIECLAICPLKKYVNQQQKVCDTVQDCSQSFIGVANLNNKISVIDFGVYKQQHIVLLYDKQMNLVNIQTGKFEKTIQYPSDAQEIKIINNEIFIVDNSNKLYQWDIDNGTKIQLGILTGKIQKPSKVVQNKQYFYIQTNSADKQQIYINAILFEQNTVAIPPLVIDLTQFEAYLFDQNLLILIANQNSLMVQELSINNNQIIANNLLQQFIQCKNESGQLISQFGPVSTFKKLENQFLLSFSSSQSILNINASLNSCNISIKDINPIKVEIIENKSLNIQLFVVQQLYEIEIYDFENKLIQQIKYINQINDITLWSQQVGQSILLKLYVLTQPSNIDVYESTSISNLQFTKVKSLLSKIDNPIKLKVYDPLATGLQQSPIVYAYNYDFSAVDIMTNSIKYMLESIETSTIPHKASILVLKATKNQSFLVSGDANGKIVTWDIQNKQDGIVYYIFDFVQEKCQQLEIYLERYIFAVFQTQIAVIDIFNPNNYSTTLITQPSSSVILQHADDYIVINIDGCLKFYNQIIAQFAFSSCNQFYSTLSAMSTLYNNQILVRSGSIIKLLSVDFTSNSVNFLNTYTFPQSIVLYKIRKYSSNSSFKIIIVDAKFNFTTVNNSFNTEMSVAISTISKAIDVNYPRNTEQEDYMVLGQSSDPKVNLKYQIYKISQTQPQIKLIFSIQFATQLLDIFVDKASDGEEVFRIPNLMPFSTVSLIYQFSYYSLKNRIESGVHPTLGGDLFTKCTVSFDQYQRNAYCGSQSGIIASTQIFRNLFYQVYTGNPQSNQPISAIQQSLSLERYFIINNVVQVYNIHTDQMEEQINFTTDTLGNVKETNINNSLKVITFIKDNEIFVRDYENGNSYSRNDLGFISGVLIDEVYQRIIVYGNGVYIFQSNSKQQPQLLFGSLDIKQCILNNIIIVCKVDTTRVIVINRQSLNQINLFISKSMDPKFRLAFDDNTSLIFLYYINVQVYDLSGNLITIFQQTLVIKEFKFYGDKIVTTSQLEINIYDRSNLTFLLKMLSQSSANIKSTFYLPSKQYLGYYTDVIRAGQIMLFSLSLLRESGTYLNQVNPNYGVMASVVNDELNNQMHTLDVVGNINNISYSTSLSIDNSLQMQQLFTQDQPYLHQVEFNTNSIFVGNQQNLYRTFQQYRRREVSFSFFIPIDGVNYVFLVDIKNVIYQYFNYQQTYLTDYQEQIIDTFTIPLTTYFGVVFKNKIIIYQATKSPQDYQITMKQIRIVEGFQYRTLVCDQIFLTYDQLIIDYDFIGGELNSSIPIGLQADKITQKICAKELQLIIFGFFSGKIGLYNRVSKEIQIVQDIQFTNQLIKSIIYDSKQIILCQISGDFVIIQLSGFQMQRISKQSYIQNQKNLELQGAKFDPIKNRYFIWYQLEKKLIVLDSSFTLIKFLSFPNDINNRLLFGNQIIVLYSPSQLNIYTRDSLKFLFRIKKQKSDIIRTLNVLNDKNIVVIYVNKVDVYSIDIDSRSYNLIDTLSINYVNQVLLQFIQISSDDQSLFLQLIGYYQYAIFDKKYSLSLANNSQNSQCMQSIIADNRMKTELLFSSIYQKQLNYSYIIQFEIVSGIELLNQIDTNTAEYIFTSLPMNNSKDLVLQKDSLSFLKKSLRLTQFSIKLPDRSLYLINSECQYAVLDNIDFQNQDFQEQTLSFQYMKSVIFNKITINSIQMRDSKSNQRILNYQNIIQNYQDLIQIFHTDELIIYDLIISNSSFDWNSVLLHVKNVTKVTIKNLTISNNILRQIIIFEDINTLKIDNLQITSNQIIKNHLITPKDLCYLLQISGVQNTQITNVSIKQNYDIGFIYSNNIVISKSRTIILNDDQFSIQIMEILDNKFGQTLKIEDINISLVNLSSSNISLENLTIQNNESNLRILDCNTLMIKQSNFNQNKAINGGALQVETVQTSLNIIDCIFTLNQAISSGGAIYLKDVKVLIIDEKTQIFYNIAIIGGGIRYFEIDQEGLQISEQAKIEKNSAEIYGNNIINQPVIIEVQIITKDQTIIKKYENINENQNFDKIVINNFQSGGTMNLVVKFKDNEDNYLNFSLSSVENSIYPQQIIDELENIEYYIIPKYRKYVQQSDESIVNSNQYIDKQQGFVKSDLQVNGNLNVQQSLLLTIQLDESYVFNNIEIVINFRACQRGEVLKKINENIRICQQCQLGFYSLVDFTSISQDTVSEDQCKKCPDSAVSCQQDIILLKNGFWRFNNRSDLILPCSRKEENCISENPENKLGCQLGYVGPLCEQCDYEGKVWGNYFTQSFGFLNCSQCNSMSAQIVYIIGVGLLLLTYFFIQLLLFMNSYMHTQVCHYLRRLNILPISYSSIRGQSNFYLKILTNYFQIASIAFNFKIKILPDALVFGPNIFGNILGQVSGNLNCLFPKQYLDSLGYGRLIQIAQSILPLIILVILFFALQVCQKFKAFQVTPYHKYTLFSFIFFFIQPDSLNLYTRSLTCRDIGPESYYSIDLNYKCNDKEYNLFTKAFSLPNLFFWVLIPIIPFYCIYKQKNKLNYCKVRLKFGYYYSEYKEKYFYWEFIRIYLKVLIVLIYTFLSHQQTLAVILSNFFIFLYIYSIVKCRPFQSFRLQKFEKFSYLIIAILMILNCFNQTYDLFIFVIIYALINYSYIGLGAFIIINEKINNRFNIIGKCFMFIILKFMPKNFSHYFKKGFISLETFQRWRKVKKNIKCIIKLRPLLFQSESLRRESMQQFTQPISCQNQAAKTINHSPFYQYDKSKSPIQKNLFSDDDLLRLEKSPPSQHISKVSNQTDNISIHIGSGDKTSQFSNKSDFIVHSKISNDIEKLYQDEEDSINGDNQSEIIQDDNMSNFSPEKRSTFQYNMSFKLQEFKIPSKN